jgi:hypothetical protein
MFEQLKPKYFDGRHREDSMHSGASMTAMEAARRRNSHLLILRSASFIEMTLGRIFAIGLAFITAMSARSASECALLARETCDLSLGVGRQRYPQNCSDPKRLRLENLSSSGWQITVDLMTNADKDNAVPGRVAAVPLDLAIGYYKTPSIFDVRASEWFVVAFVSDDGDVLIILHLIAVGPISIG